MCNRCNYARYKHLWQRYSKERYARTKSSGREERRQRWNDWAARNKHVVRAKSARWRAKKYAATVAWASKTAIRAIYRRARDLTKQTGVRHHVDHVVPLKSPIVCGLHWEGNLQVLPIKANSAKGNRWWPDMP